MLETEDIDDDYFTPASSTSLANIFGKTRKEDETENESLKYTPPKPAKPEEPKATQCIMACALVGYEWLNGAYVSRGKLGFAILKITKTGIYNAVLYDSNKTTLSCATISLTFEVTLKENVYFSYHDNQQKYWSLYASQNDMEKIIDFLKSLNALVICSSEEDKELPQTTQQEDKEEPDSKVNDQGIKQDKESDTDSSINRKTKMSILNRMATMGHSVLPPRAVSTERTSDSSDTNETSHYKTVRHKPIKAVMKRNSSDKNLQECQSLVESSGLNVDHTTNSVPLFTYVNGQLAPVTNSNVITSNSSGNDMSLFFSEQRVSNSEVRINVTRLTDKVDQVLGKLTVIENKDKNSANNNFQLEVLQKLLAEYENKIKMYEEFIKSKDFSHNSSTPLIGLLSKENEMKLREDHTKKIASLDQLNKDKDDKIAQLKAELESLNDKFKTENESKKELMIENDRLRQELNNKNEQVTDKPQDSDDGMVGDKIKNIMNDTFRSVSANFESNEEYSGERVKAITASIIKKVTIEALKKL